MFFTECERLAERHPDFAGTVQRIDAELAKMSTDGIIRTADMASFLEADPNQVDAVLEKLAHEKLLRREEMVECPYCGGQGHHCLPSRREVEGSCAIAGRGIREDHTSP